MARPIFVFLLVAITTTVESQLVRIPLVHSLFDKELTVDNFQRLHKSRFYGVMSVGVPPQSFKVAFDTTTSDVWLPSIKCTDPACNAHNRYNSSASRTHKPDGKIAEVFVVSGTISGYYSRDHIQLGKAEIQDQLFAEIMHIPIEAMVDAAFDGVIGMNLGSDQEDTMPLFVNLALQSFFEPVFSFYLNRKYPISAVQRSELILGGVDAKHFTGEFTYVPVANDFNLWEITMSGVDVGDRSVCNKNCVAILTSGDYIISGPVDQVSAINFAMEGVTTNGKEFLLDCAYFPLLPNITFWIEYMPFVLTPADYVLRRNNVCLSGLVGLEGKEWYLGELFMSRYYTVFDVGNRRVGFALAT